MSEITSHELRINLFKMVHIYNTSIPHSKFNVIQNFSFPLQIPALNANKSYDEIQR